ncbi:Protein CBG22622 [Caenorhabditis briggsae]|uniref:Protein CBG22622 n=1 Tax=Caenorhabditis briggsae TaxID=6238 RepID=A8Y2P9_CAEBR|nr:Protein CBG22622 [Caenorhabditis briggsae]CAP39174.2 Protein CBG22622 [Caenorhabditis briggsae]
MDVTPENEKLLLLGLISGTLITVFLYCIFPVFVQVYRSNRENYKSNPLYPVINQLYRFLWGFHISVILLIVYIYLMTSNKLALDGIVFMFLTAMICILFYIVLVYLLVYQLFKLSILAFQSFLKFIFPSSNSSFLYPKFSKNASNMIYILFLMLLAYQSYSLMSQPFYQTGEMFRTFYLPLNAILLVATFLNIIIFIKNELRPVKKPDPLQKWMFFQTVLISGFKLLHFWVPFFIGDGGKAMQHYIIISIGSDILTCVMFVQVSYLIVYRHKIRDLKFEDLFSSAFSQQGRIEPRESIQSLSSIRF